MKKGNFGWDGNRTKISTEKINQMKKITNKLEIETKLWQIGLEIEFEFRVEISQKKLQK